jgi:hypothetical protein
LGDQPGQLSYEEQVRMFTASIVNGKKLIRLIKEELENDNEGYGLENYRDSFYKLQSP